MSNTAKDEFRLLYFNAFFVAPEPKEPEPKEPEPNDMFFNGINLSSLERSKKPKIKVFSSKNIRGLLPWEK